MSKARNKFIQENEREPTTDELLEILNDVYGKGIKNKNDLLDINYASIDIDTSDDDDNYSGSDIVNYNRASASYNEYEKTETNEFNTKLISSLLTVLSPREQQVIKMRFGLYDDNGLHREYELNEIAEILGLTSERVRQLELEAMKTLREEYKNRLSEL
jgi:RNA polymerase sigma factor (sigma-70 family)